MFILIVYSYCLFLLFILIVYSYCLFLLFILIVYSYCLFLLFILIVYSYCLLLLFILIVYSYCLFLLIILIVYSYCLFLLFLLILNHLRLKSRVEICMILSSRKKNMSSRHWPFLDTQCRSHPLRAVPSKTNKKMFLTFDLKLLGHPNHKNGLYKTSNKRY